MDHNVRKCTKIMILFSYFCIKTNLVSIGSTDYPQHIGMFQCQNNKNVPAHDKTYEMSCVPSKDSAWSESLLCPLWVAKDPIFLHADSEDSDQTGRMPRLIWVFAGRTCHFVRFVLCWHKCLLNTSFIWTCDDDEFRFNDASTHEGHLRQNGELTWFCNETIIMISHRLCRYAGWSGLLFAYMLWSFCKT